MNILQRQMGISLMEILAIISPWPGRRDGVIRSKTVHELIFLNAQIVCLEHMLSST